MDLIKDETDVGQVVRVTYDEGVEFLNYNDVSVNFIITTPFLNPMKRKISLDTLEDRGHDELRLFLMKVVHALQTTKFVNTLKIVSKPVSILKLLLPYSDQAYCFAPCDRGGGRGGGRVGAPRSRSVTLKPLILRPAKLCTIRYSPFLPTSGHNLIDTI